MFDFGFSEVLLTSVIALIVLGPEKLPRAASQVGRWVGRARAMARQFREQLEEEVNLENVKKAHKEEEAKREAEAKQGGGAEGAAGVNPAAGPGSTQGPDMDPTRAAGHDTAAAAGQPANTSGATAGHDPASQQNTSGDQATTEGLSHTEGPYTQAASSTGVPFSDQISPDPAEFRADTFSHAHPTNEFGANPLTVNGAAETTPPPAPVGTSHGASAQQPHDPVSDPATSAAPSPAPLGSGASSEPHRPDGGEAYASTSAPVPVEVPPQASETPTNAHSTTSPEKSGPA